MTRFNAFWRRVSVLVDVDAGFEQDIQAEGCQVRPCTLHRFSLGPIVQGRPGLVNRHRPYGLIDFLLEGLRDQFTMQLPLRTFNLIAVRNRAFRKDDFVRCLTDAIFLPKTSSSSKVSQSWCSWTR